LGDEITMELNKKVNILLLLTIILFSYWLWNITPRWEKRWDIHQEDALNYIRFCLSNNFCPEEDCKNIEIQTDIVLDKFFATTTARVCYSEELVQTRGWFSK